MLRGTLRFGLLAIAASLSACSPAGNANIATQAGEPSAVAQSPVTPPPSAARAEDIQPSPRAPGERTAPFVPGRPGRIFIFAGFDTGCRPLAPPELSVSKPPAQGDVSFRPGQATTVAASASGNCTGQKATGTGVYYTARAGSAGADSFSVTARMPTGETMTRDFTVRIAND